MTTIAPTRREAQEDDGGPIGSRARSLLSQLTLDERLSLLHQFVPAIPRLGLSAFHTGCEALHGVAWLGRATVFPQAVGLAATWDVDLLRAVGEVTSVEVRAKRAADPTVSLNVWAPVVNPLRHPGWGRNEEGYSEDPHLTGLLATAYCAGLRGDHKTVWRTVPALKHFLGYNNETDRSVTDSNLSLRTLHTEELAAFRGPVEAGVAGGIMLSYNRVNGVPAHTQPELVAEARSWAPGSLAVVSDAGAPTFLVTSQRTEPDRVHAAAALVRGGLDSFTDDDASSAPTLDALREALRLGLLTTDEVDRAALRILELRLRTGELDDDDPYRGIGPESLDLPEHRALAREAVGRSVVVLRNAAGLLPLAEPARIAVVGPLADLVLTDWYAGTPPYEVGIATGLRERYPDAEVEVADSCDHVALRSVSADRYLVSDATGSVVQASATDATADTGFAVTDWGDGVLTLRSTASGKLVTGGTWPARADAERVGGWVVQETFRRHVHPDGSWSLLHLGSGRWLRVMRDSGLVAAEAVVLEQAERFVVRTLRSGLADAASAAARADLVVVAVGNDPHLAGRETEDRPHLWLPESAAELWRTAAEANPRSVLAIVSSYPYVLGPGVADAATIVWSSHGGQELGHGVADVLSGDREPTGRLTQSWPAHPDQAGDLFDYDTLAQQATYRHQPNPYAFAFGHGCTYTTVSYDAVRLDSGTATCPPPTLRHPALVAGDEPVARATVRLSNRGDRPAEELVQLYVLGPGDLPIPTPRRLLVAYRRVRLEPGEQRTVELTFPLARLAVWEDALRLPEAPADWLHAGALRVQPGRYILAAGPSADNLVVTTGLEVR